MTTAHWQDQFAATRIYRIAVADAETTPPVRVGRGEMINWDEDADWTANPFSFSEDDFDITEVADEELVARGASDPLKRGVFHDSVPGAWDRIEIPVAEIGQKILDWATNVTQVGDRFISGLLHTRVALVIEHQGLGFHYLPSVEISAPFTEGGRRRMTRQNLVVNIFGTTDLPEGQAWFEYGASS